jgi:hypothetical protein
MQADEDLDTLEGAVAFLNRIRHEAQTRGVISLRPSQFVRAVELGAIEYISDRRGVSFNGQYVGECSPSISGAAVILCE